MQFTSQNNGGTTSVSIGQEMQLPPEKFNMRHEPQVYTLVYKKLPLNAIKDSLGFQAN